MKKKTPEGLIRLLGADEYFEVEKRIVDEFNCQIKMVYRMYLVYAYFLLGEMHETMTQITAQKQLENSEQNKQVLQYTEMLCEGILACKLSDYSKA